MVAVGQVGADANGQRRISRLTVYRVGAIVVLHCPVGSRRSVGPVFPRRPSLDAVLVVRAFFKMLVNSVFWHDFGVTMLEIVTGFLIGTFLGMHRRD